MRFRVEFEAFAGQDGCKVYARRDFSPFTLRRCDTRCHQIGGDAWLRPSGAELGESPADSEQENGYKSGNAADNGRPPHDFLNQREDAVVRTRILFQVVLSYRHRSWPMHVVTSFV
jgi:hypothetical protein